MIFLAGANELSEQIVGQFGWAALFSLVGLVIVTAVLAILVVILTMLSKFINLPIFERKKADKHAAVEHIAHTHPHGAGKDEVVAAITAALSVIYASQYAAQNVAEEDEVPPPPFIIKSIKKI